VQDIESQKRRLTAPHLPDGESQHQVVEQDGGTGGPDEKASRGGGTLGPAIRPNREVHRQIAQGEKDGGAGQCAEVEPLDAHHVNGKETTGQDAGSGQESESRKK